MIYHLLTKYHRVCFLKWDFEYSVKYFCHAFQIFLCWNQFRITWQIVIDTQAQLRLSLMSKYPHNYLLNNWVSYKNIQVGTLSQISSEIEQPLALASNISPTNNAFRQWRKCFGKVHLSGSFKHSDYPHSLSQTEHFAFGNRQSIPQCVLSLFLGWDKTCFLLLISLFICCRYWKCKLWVDQKNVWDE